MNTNNIGKVLGQVVEYPEYYDKSILVREERIHNRGYLNIDEEKLPFVGFDTWNAYEVSTLDCLGNPFVGIAKIVYSCTSKYIVESKSIKLYLNSFNMTRAPESDDICISTWLEQTIETDLSELLETNVDVHIRQVAALPANEDSYSLRLYNKDFLRYVDITDYCVDTEFVGEYTERPDLFESIDTGDVTVKAVATATLFSRCKITKQPDHGTVFVYMKGQKHFTDESFLKYIASFRGENHFHEEICECIYQRLYTLFEPSELMVTCMYTRRGGIDINPCRASHEYLLPYSLYDMYTDHIQYQRQ